MSEGGVDSADGAGAADPGVGVSAGWLNRSVLGMGLTSFLADAGYETATSILPGFLMAIGAPAVALGLIEGLADAASSFVKLAAGWWGDRLGRRKPVVTLGYALSGSMTALFAMATAWPLVLLGKTVAWLGKGVRGPLRDALLAESVPAAALGRAFGFHRAGDTLGAILGPLLAAGLLQWLPASGTAAQPFRIVFWLTIIPGLASAVVFAAAIRERRTAGRKTRLWASLRALPAPFRRLLVGAGVFGAGNFSHTLLILAVMQSLTPPGSAPEALTRAAGIGAALYALRNALYAGASFPVGALSDRYSRRKLLAGGYAFGAVVMIAFAALFARGAPDVAMLTVLVGLAGVSVAFEDALEGALTADLVPDPTMRGTAFGTLGMVNGLGDLLSSAMVGVLWDQVGKVSGFAYAAALMLGGAVLLLRVR